MAQEAIRKANRLADATLDSIDVVYVDVVRSVTKSHRKTLEKLEELRTAGKRGAARAIFRSSGLLNALAESITEAGRDAAVLIGRQRADILEVMEDDDGF